MRTIKEYILSSLADGKYFFTKAQALSALDLNQNQFLLQLSRLYRKKSVKNLGHQFFMIVPPEYTHFGSVPSHWIVDPLMRYLKNDYYIGLLTAASMYGATLQQPMTFQVISNQRMRNIQLERGAIEFHLYKGCSSAIKEHLKVPTGAGYVQISTREQTAVDLVHFYPVCGFLSNVASVVLDLAEKCQAEALARVIQNEKMVSVLQRLGYILELGGFLELAATIENELKQRKMHYTLLYPDIHVKSGVRLPRWKLIINEMLEIER